jgi:RNA polymerase sigma factor (sigma-70 family)
MRVLASDVYRSLIDDDPTLREIVRRVIEQVDPEKDPKLHEFKLSFLPYLVAGLFQEAAREFASHDWPLSRLKQHSYKYGYSAQRFAPLVEDLLQKIAVAILQGRFGFDPSHGKSLDAYLSGALRNSVINDAKVAGRELLLEGQHPTFVLKEDHRGGPDINLAKLERLLVEKLEKRHKRIFKLLYRERRTIAEIAKELNVQPESAKRAVSRCNSAIRKVLKELGLLEQLSIFTED